MEDCIREGALREEACVERALRRPQVRLHCTRSRPQQLSPSFSGTVAACAVFTSVHLAFAVFTFEELLHLRCRVT